MLLRYGRHAMLGVVLGLVAGHARVAHAATSGSALFTAPPAVGVKAGVPRALPPKGVPVAEVEPPRFFLGGGAIAYNLSKYATQATGEKTLTLSPYPQIVAMGRFRPWGKWGISPIAAYTPFAHTNVDGESTRLLIIAARGTRTIGILDLQAGVGLLNVIVSGAGGLVKLNNGNTTTSFGIPLGTSTSNLLYWEAGTSLAFWRFRWETAVLLTAPLSSRRTVSLTTQLCIGVF
jgi:hypothetical protein